MTTTTSTSTPTPREDAALLRVATELRWAELSPALQQVQWRAVAQCVATATGSPLKSHEETQRRYESLLQIATITERTQWPEDEELRKMLQATLEKHQKISETVAAKETEDASASTSTDEKTVAEPAASLEETQASTVDTIPAREAEPVGVCNTVAEPMVSSQDVPASAVAPGKPTAVEPIVQPRPAPIAGPFSNTSAAAVIQFGGKRKRVIEYPKTLSVQQDAAILRVVGELKPGTTKSKWMKVAERVTSEMASVFLSMECEARYGQLMEMSPVDVQARFGQSVELVALVTAAQAEFAVNQVQLQPELNDSGATQDAMTSSKVTTLPATISQASPEGSRAPVVVLRGAAAAAVPVQARPPPPRSILPASSVADMSTTNLVTPVKVACVPVVVTNGKPMPIQAIRPKTDRDEIEELKKTVASLTVAMTMCKRRQKEQANVTEQLEAKVRRLENSRHRVQDAATQCQNTVTALEARFNSVQLEPTPALLKDIGIRLEQNTRLVVETKKLIHAEIAPAQTVVAKTERLVSRYSAQIDRSERLLLQMSSTQATEMQRLASEQQKLDQRIAALTAARAATETTSKRQKNAGSRPNAVQILADEDRRPPPPVAVVAASQSDPQANELLRMAAKTAQHEATVQQQQAFARLAVVEKNERERFVAEFRKEREAFEKTISSNMESLQASLTLVITRMREHQDVQTAVVAKIQHAQDVLQAEMKQQRVLREEFKSSIQSDIKQLSTKFKGQTKDKNLMTSSIKQLQEQQASLVKKLDSEITPLHEVQESLRAQITEMQDQHESHVVVLTSEIKALRQKQESISTSVDSDIKALREAHEALAASTKEEAETIRQLQESNGKAVKDLVVKQEETEIAERARQTIFFEMVESETLKREELAALVQKQQEKCQSEQAARQEALLRLYDEVNKREELAALVQKQQEKYEGDQATREEALLCIQDEIQQELQQLQDRFSEEVSSYRDVLDAIRNEQISSGEAFENKITTVAKHQEDTKRHLLDQYLKSTLQLHELRNAVERERQERSEEFTSLLQNIQQLINTE